MQSEFSQPIRRLIVLVMGNVNLLDLSGPVQVAHAAIQRGWPCELLFCGTRAEKTSAQGLGLAQLQPLPAFQMGDVILIPGISTNVPIERYVAQQWAEEGALLPWLHVAEAAGVRFASICTGAYVLGEAGLLNGRRCTTHWSSVADLQQRYPQARVVENVLYMEDGRVMTSAGIASGIDLALSLVEAQCGPLLAAQVARDLVVYLRRNGAQAQTSLFLEYRTHLHAGVHRAQDYLGQHANAPFVLAEVAEAAAMSPRHLSRSFKEATGLTPLHYHQRLRMEVAAHLVTESDLSIEAIAHRCGFDDVRHFRRLWQQFFHVAPSLSRAEQPRP